MIIIAIKTTQAISLNPKIFAATTGPQNLKNFRILEILDVDIFLLHDTH